MLSSNGRDQTGHGIPGRHHWVEDQPELVEPHGVVRADGPTDPKWDLNPVGSDDVEWAERIRLELRPT
jgi:hypothetical protein